ncbi:MAG: ABC transporter permease [Myxococcaceae bacterium]|nr:ABC transporter permease [Myxococcaceae bacterium]
MRNTLAIARKELSAYFTTPWAYIVFTMMLGITSFFFVAILQDFSEVQEMVRANGGWAQAERLDPGLADYKNLTDGVVMQLWGVLSVVTLFLAPFLAMRLFAEEKRSRTMELLMTVPVRPVEIVLGKYLGGLGVIGTTLGLTIVFPLTLALFGRAETGSAIEWSTVLLGYGGLLLWGATCMAIGMFLSALTESQMLAAILTFALLLPWMLLRGVARGAEEPLRSILHHLSFDAQLEGLTSGVLDLKALVFFASVILFSLLLTHRAVEAQRWA